MLGTGIVKGTVETARNFVGTYTDREARHSCHAPHRDLAEKFINYILDLKVSAQLANYDPAGSPNQVALEFINPADRANPRPRS